MQSIIGQKIMYRYILVDRVLLHFGLRKDRNQLN